MTGYFQDSAMFGSANLTNQEGTDVFVAKLGSDFKNQPPNTPSITGPTKGKIKVAVAYNFTTTDPDGDDVYYFIDWGDGSDSGWIGPYSSGDVIPQSHTWKKKGDYVIKAKARDIHGNESGWEELSVTMPYSYSLPFVQLWIRLFQRFPNAFPLLRYLMGY